MRGWRCSVGFQVEWDNDEQYVLRYTVTGRWTWEQFYAARDQARQMADAAAATYVNSIIDLRAGSLFPQNALTHFRRMPSEAHPKLKNGNVVVIENNLFVRSLMDIMRRLNRQAMRNFYIAPTLEDARAILDKLQVPAQSVA